MKLKRKGIQKIKLIDAPCEYYLKTVLEKHVSSESIPLRSALIDDHDQVAIVISSMKRTVSTNHRLN